MSQTEKILKALTKYGTNTPGISPRQLATKAKVSMENVYKRIHDLRNEGVTIYSNTRSGAKFYRLAA